MVGSLAGCSMRKEQLAVRAFPQTLASTCGPAAAPSHDDAAAIDAPVGRSFPDIARPPPLCLDRCHLKPRNGLLYEVCSRGRWMKNTMSIRPLPDEVVAQIKSSTTIVSLTGVVLELLKNSLDAKASKVDITVDFARGGCVVEDNGLGIPPAEFSQDGGLGKLYCMCRLHICKYKPNLTIKTPRNFTQLNRILASTAPFSPRFQQCLF